MSRTRVVYILSLLGLGVLLVLTVFRPLATGEGYTQVQGQQLLETGDEWVVEMNIVNQEGWDMEYVVKALAGGETYREEVAVGAGRTYKYIYHIKRGGLQEEEAAFAIYREGEDRPLERVTYYLK